MEYQVEAIRKWRYNLRNECKEWYIKWFNYDELENTWEPLENLNCHEILKEFEENLAEKERKYYYAKRPQNLNGFQRNAGYVRWIGADKQHEDQDRNPFYVLVEFDDSDQAEEIPPKEFFKHNQKGYFEFCESRLFLRREGDEESTVKGPRVGCTPKIHINQTPYQIQ